MMNGSMSLKRAVGVVSDASGKSCKAGLIVDGSGGW